MNWSSCRGVKYSSLLVVEGKEAAASLLSCSYPLFGVPLVRYATGVFIEFERDAGSEAASLEAREATTSPTREESSLFNPLPRSLFSRRVKKLLDASPPSLRMCSWSPEEESSRTLLISSPFRFNLSENIPLPRPGFLSTFGLIVTSVRPWEIAGCRRVQLPVSAGFMAAVVSGVVFVFFPPKLGRQI